MLINIHCNKQIKALIKVNLIRCFIFHRRRWWLTRFMGLIWLLPFGYLIFQRRLGDKRCFQLWINPEIYFWLQLWPDKRMRCELLTCAAVFWGWWRGGRPATYQPRSHQEHLWRRTEAPGSTGPPGSNLEANGREKVKGPTFRSLFSHPGLRWSSLAWLIILKISI